METRKDRLISFEVKEEFESPATKGKMLRPGMKGQMRERLLKKHMEKIRVLDTKTYEKQEEKKLVKLKKEE